MERNKRTSDSREEFIRMTWLWRYHFRRRRNSLRVKLGSGNDFATPQSLASSGILQVFDFLVFLLEKLRHSLDDTPQLRNCSFCSFNQGTSKGKGKSFTSKIIFHRQSAYCPSTFVLFRPPLLPLKITLEGQNIYFNS